MAGSTSKTRKNGVAKGFAADVRNVLAPQLDTFVLQRFRALSRRGEGGRNPRAVEREVIDAFDQLNEDLKQSDRRPENYVETVTKAFENLWDKGTGVVASSARLRRAIIDQFHRLYYHSPKQTWKNTFYRGVAIWKCPLDMWLYQEILHEVKPDLIIETGTAFGGSAYYLSDLCETMGHGKVVTIDIKTRPGQPTHDRLTYLVGSSVDSEMVDKVRQMLPKDGKVLVILDSDHSAPHVKKEIETWADWVTPGSYMIVEDSNIKGNPVQLKARSGPMSAINEFVKSTDEFVVDESKHKFMLTFNPRGYLKRIG